MAATRISFSYPEEMRKKLEEMAKEDNRSLSSFVQILLREGIEKRNRAKKKEEKAETVANLKPAAKRRILRKEA